MTEFALLADTLDQVAAVSGRNAKIGIVASFLSNIDTGEIGIAATFLGGRVFSETDNRTLNMSWSGLKQALRQVIEFTTKDLTDSYTGDTGDAVASLLESDKFVRQTSLVSNPLTLKHLDESFAKIASLEGAGSKRKRESILAQIIREASPREAKYIVALVLNDMRIGLSEGLLVEGIAKAFSIDSDIVRRAWSLSGDLGSVASVAASMGERGLGEIGVEVFRPVKPMLATPADAISDILSQFNEQVALEMKFDGARAQIHKDGTNVAIYSRRLQDVTEGLPDIVEKVKTRINAERIILDGEIVAVDSQGQPYPFQVVMKRFGRTQEIEKTRDEVQLQLHLFDVLMVDDRQLIDDAYHERRQVLNASAPSDLVTESVITDDIAEAERLFEISRENGHEGLMVKRIASTYVPGSRGRNWFKIKHTLETMDLVIIGAEWGHGRRSKWLSDYHLAVRDPDTGSYIMVGKTFKGLTDSEFQEMTSRLQSLAIEKKGHVVAVKPEIVVEVLASEIQESPTYDSGMALRFARIVSIRDDKGPEDAMTITQLERVFSDQFRFKAKQ